MFPIDLPNPFDGTPVVHESVSVPPGHVAELHAPVLAVVHRQIAAAKTSRTPSSVLVRGEAGSGKSHLLAQLRDESAGDAAVLVVGINLFGSYAGAFWRHVCKELMTDLLREPRGGGANGLTRIIHARYPQWGTTKTTGASILDVILGKEAAPTLAQILSREADLPPSLRTVLARLYDHETVMAAADWLKGGLLSDDQLNRLGLPVASETDREREANAREIVLAICRLAAGSTVLVLGFDNIESCQAALTDANALRDLTWLIGELATGHGARVVITFARPEIAATIRKATDHAAVQRIASVETQISWLSQWEYVVRLVAARLEASAPWAGLRKQHTDPYWPFDEPFLRDILAKNKRVLTPRHLIGACRVRLEELRRTGAPIVLKVAEDEPAPKDTSFDKPWQSRRDKYLAKPLAVTFDSVIGLGLPWLREAVEAPVVPFGEAVDALPDVSLLFRPAGGGRMIGVTCCNQEPAQLWRRLDRLKKQWAVGVDGGLLRALVVVRLASAHTTPVAATRLTALQEAGVTVLRLPREQYAELAAYQQILAHVQAGNYTDFGRPVSAEEFARWARGHLSSAVKEMADAVFGPTAGKKAAKKPAAVMS